MIPAGLLTVMPQSVVSFKEDIKWLETAENMNISQIEIESNALVRTSAQSGSLGLFLKVA